MEKDRMEQPMYMTQNYNQWVRGSCNTLDHAQNMSSILFEKDFFNLWTYERQYVVKQLVKRGV